MVSPTRLANGIPISGNTVYALNCMAKKTSERVMTCIPAGFVNGINPK